MNLSQGNRMKKQIFHSTQNYSKYGFLPPWWSRRNICLHQDRNILAKIHSINRFSEYLIILNFSFWWIWSLKKLKCLFDFEKAQDKIRFLPRQGGHQRVIFRFLSRTWVGATSISSTSFLLIGCWDTREFLNSSVYCTNIIRVAFWTKTRCAKTLKIIRPFPEKWRRRENVNLKDENERESAN